MTGAAPPELGKKTLMGFPSILPLTGAEPPELGKKTLMAAPSTLPLTGAVPPELGKKTLIAFPSTLPLTGVAPPELGRKTLTGIGEIVVSALRSAMPQQNRATIRAIEPPRKIDLKYFPCTAKKCGNFMSKSL